MLLAEKLLDENIQFQRVALRHLIEIENWSENRRKETERWRKYWKAKEGLNV